MDYQKLDDKLKKSEAYKFWEKNQKFIHAIIGVIIIIAVVGMWFNQYHSNKLAKEISLNCGWGEEDYYCFCEKSEAVMLKNIFEEQQEGDIDVSLGK